MSSLKDMIQKASQDYYSSGTSNLTDAEFDTLLDKLKEEDPDSPLLDVGHGYDVSKVAGDKFPHKYGLIGSLPKCRTWDELKPEFKNVQCDVSLKLDGISVVMYYEHGSLVKALTRGDGTLGIDITAKVVAIDNTYSHIDEDFNGAIRGEILMSYDNFDEFIKIHPEAKNPRNSTAGLIGSNEITNDFKFLSIVVYTMVGDENTSEISLKHMRWCLQHWFGDNHVVPYSESAMFDNSDRFLDWMDSYQDSWYGEYPADGLVITLNSVQVNSNTHEIKYTAMAFKFPAEVKKSEVLEINWEMSKFNYAIPVVRIKPVELAGTVVQNASGFNAAYIRDSKLGPGSGIEISKHGEIIPGIDNILSATYADLPAHCPRCKSTLEWAGVHLACKNMNCPNVLEQDTLIWLNNICPTDFLGDKLRLKYLYELFGDDISIENIMAASDKNFGNLDTSGHDKLIFDMLTALYSNSEIKLSSALLATNIPRLGDITAKKLAEECPEILHALVAGEYDDIQFNAISTIVGPATATSIRDNIEKYKRLRYIEQRISWEQSQVAEVKFKVAITGKLSVSRSQFETELTAHGYKVGELKNDTKYLITDNPDSGSSKNAKADKLGIEKITEAEFRVKFF